jgi:hypothetical protein
MGKIICIVKSILYGSVKQETAHSHKSKISFNNYDCAIENLAFSVTVCATL